MPVSCSAVVGVGARGVEAAAWSRARSPAAGALLAGADLEAAEALAVLCRRLLAGQLVGHPLAGAPVAVLAQGRRGRGAPGGGCRSAVGSAGTANRSLAVTTLPRADRTLLHPDSSAPELLAGAAPSRTRARAAPGRSARAAAAEHAGGQPQARTPGGEEEAPPRRAAQAAAAPRWRCAANSSPGRSSPPTSRCRAHLPHLLVDGGVGRRAGRRLLAGLALLSAC
jgi:hypothetical protein